MSDRPDAAGRDYRHRVLVLQGGGALGSYQAGVFEGLAGAGIGIDWVAGISIGALNAALIAGNPPERRIERLHAFWDEICQPPSLWPALPEDAAGLDFARLPRPVRAWFSLLQSSRAVVAGQRGFFRPRRGPLPWLAGRAAPAEVSYYDTAPLRATLLRLVDFDRINAPGAMRVSVGAVDVRSGDQVYFDSHERPLTVDHVMASAALPPSFPPVQVDGEYYWDGGVLMNTPLVHVLRQEPREDLLVFQIDLWNAQGDWPTSLPEVEERKKDIVYSSRTRMVNRWMRERQAHRKAIAALLELVPAERRDDPAVRRAAALACDRRCNVQQLICADGGDGGSAKDYEFGAATMRRHWHAGRTDIGRALARPDWAAMPTEDEPFVVHLAPPVGSGRVARRPRDTAETAAPLAGPWSEPAGATDEPARAAVEAPHHG